MNQERITSYLNRMNYEEEIKLDTETLSGMIKAHLENIPFENLDVFDFKKIPELDEEALFEKIVTNKRGGYCFELNSLLYYLLDSLGFTVYPVAARILWNKETPPPLGHMALVVIIDGESYLCDVGYGGPGPKGLIRLAEEEQTVQDAVFRFTKKEEVYDLERLHHGEWKKVFSFCNRPFELVDFELLNYFAATSDKMIFRRARILNLCTPNGSKALMDMELKIVENGVTTVKTYADSVELHAGIEEHFGIPATLNTNDGH